MKVRIACLTLGLAGLACASPSFAADWNYGAGSIKDLSGTSGIPVPAPIPVPTYKGGWYIRLDAGVGVIGAPDFSESGWTYATIDGPGPITALKGDARTSNPAWFGSKFDTFATWGGGAGYNFGNGFRFDLTGEKRTDGNFYIDGHDSWQTYRYDNVTRTWGPNAGWKTSMDVVDRTKIGGSVWTANLYYDLWKGHDFTPYVGGGVGFSWNVLGRNHQETATRCDTVNDPQCNNIVNVVSTSVDNREDRVSLAAAAMVGVSYDLTEITTLDVGYRYLYIDGTTFALDIAKDHSRVDIGSQSIHQMRAGLRFNFN